MKLLYSTSLLALAVSIAACHKNNSDAVVAEPQIKLENYSVTPALVKKLNGFENLEVYSLFSSADDFAASPGYVFGGSADGTGTIKNPNGDGFIMLVNNEDNFSVSKISLDKNFKPVKGQNLLNSDAGQWRLCSGTMATQEINGFGPLYFSVGESGPESQTHAINPITGSSTIVSGFAKWSGENAVPFHKDAYPGKTLIIIGEDASDVSGGQVVLYVSNTVGDLDNGSQYMLKRVDNNQKETDMVVGTSYDVEFMKIENHKTLTGSQIQALVDPLKAIKFGRVEDMDFRKGSASGSREFYINVTGQAKVGDNADGSRTVNGRVYQLIFDAANPLKGKLVCILDGDDNNGIAKDFQNPDNICVTDNFAYIQEDSNGYGTEDHDAYIYQYHLASKQLKKVLELDHRRNDPTYKATAKKGDWEYGALVDISDIIGIPNTFSLAIQPHTWRTDRFKGVDGGTKRPNENQGSQVVVIKNLPR